MEQLILIGNKRFILDFKYIFDEYEYIYEAENVEEYFVLDKSFRNGIKVVLCVFNSAEMEKKLIRQGLVYRDNYLFARDYINGYGKEVILWGIGKICRDFLEQNSELKVKYYIDSNTNVNEFNNTKVLHPSELQRSVGDFIIITNSFYYDIKPILTEKGYQEGKDFINYTQYVDLVNMLKKTIYANPTADVECNEPFEFCQVAGGGECNLCCTGLMVSAGDIYTDTFSHVWNSIRAKIIRLSVINKTYVFCDEKPCPYIVSKREYGYDELFNSESYKRKTATYPKRLNVSIDHTCNLKCRHCRNEILIANNVEKAKMSIMAERLVQEVLPNVNVLIMAGNGEVFFSDIYKKIWKFKGGGKRKIINILTNGILFDMDVFHELEQRYEKIGFGVSIDAATEKTYSIVRRGSFKKVVKTMELLGKLKKEKRIQYVHMNFVVRQDNCHELHDFIVWGKQLGVDRIYISKVENWVYSAEEFENVTIFHEDNSIKKEFKKYFADPILHDPIVHLINIGKSLERIYD